MKNNRTIFVKMLMMSALCGQSLVARAVSAGELWQATRGYVQAKSSDMCRYMAALGASSTTYSEKLSQGTVLGVLGGLGLGLKESYDPHVVGLHVGAGVATGLLLANLAAATKYSVDSLAVRYPSLFRVPSLPYSWRKNLKTVSVGTVLGGATGFAGGAFAGAMHPNSMNLTRGEVLKVFTRGFSVFGALVGGLMGATVASLDSLRGQRQREEFVINIDSLDLPLSKAQKLTLGILLSGTAISIDHQDAFEMVKELNTQLTEDDKKELVQLRVNSETSIFRLLKSFHCTLRQSIERAYGVHETIVEMIQQSETFKDDINALFTNADQNTAHEKTILDCVSMVADDDERMWIEFFYAIRSVVPLFNDTHVCTFLLQYLKKSLVCDIKAINPLVQALPNHIIQNVKTDDGHNMVSICCSRYVKNIRDGRKDEETLILIESLLTKDAKHESFVECLVKVVTDMATLISSGKWTEHQRILSRYEKLLNLLIRYGVDSTEKNSYGFSAQSILEDYRNRAFPQYKDQLDNMVKIIVGHRAGTVGVVNRSMDSVETTISKPVPDAARTAILECLMGNITNKEGQAFSQLEPRVKN